MSELETNPATLVVAVKEHALKILADGNSTECEAAGKVAISDSNGDSERQCGWDGRTWVIETAYAHSYTRTDRYELSKDGKQLTYFTEVSGGRMPTIKLKRVYTVVVLGG